MINYNKVILVGNLTDDPIQKETPGGVSFCLFTVATSKTYKDASGQFQSTTQYHSCIAWRKLVEIITKISKKGSRVFIEGELNNSKWKDENDVTHKKTEIICHNFILLETRREQESQQDYNDNY